MNVLSWSMRGDFLHCYRRSGNKLEIAAGLHNQTGVSLRKSIACRTLNQEDTPVSIRIQLSPATVKDLQTRLQQAYKKDEVRLVRPHYRGNRVARTPHTGG